MSKREDIDPPPAGGAEDGYEVSFPLGTELDQLTLARLADPPEDTSAISREELVGLAARIYDTRRARANFFTSSLLGEPVWDMLLTLYCLPPRGVRLSITSLCDAANVPATTALRWVQLLETKDLIERQKDPYDARRCQVSLTAAGERLMTAYLASIFDKLRLS